MAPNAKQLDKITGIKFKTDIVFNTDQCPNFVKKTDVQSDSVAFTVHIPFEQLKCRYDNKLLLSNFLLIILSTLNILHFLFLALVLYITTELMLFMINCTQGRN